jgi:hypothetical protein
MKRLSSWLTLLTTGFRSSSRFLEWNAHDLETDDGIKIEGKSAAYIQSWEQKKLSEIRFDIGKKQSWFVRRRGNSRCFCQSSLVAPAPLSMVVGHHKIDIVSSIMIS